MRRPRSLFIWSRPPRPLKRWTWVGAFAEEAIVCAARAWVGGVPASWWCVVDRRTGGAEEGRGGVTVSPSVLRVRDRVALDVGGGEPIEVVSPHGGAWAWTRKTGGGRARGWVALGGERVAVDADAIVDESAGYHARHTEWRWSAGAGVAASGAAVAWNLVAGLHDADGASERRVWVDGVPHEVGCAAFGEDLASVTAGGWIAHDPWRIECAREHVLRQRRNMLVVRSDLEQRFGAVSGTLPIAGELARAWGVVERHDVHW